VEKLIIVVDGELHTARVVLIVSSIQLAFTLKQAWPWIKVIIVFIYDTDTK